MARLFAELVAATGWLPHTTRAALTGLRKRGYAVGIDRADKVRGSVYRIEPTGAVTLPCEKRERSTPYGFSSRRDGLAPRGHRRGA